MTRQARITRRSALLCGQTTNRPRRRSRHTPMSWPSTSETSSTPWSTFIRASVASRRLTSRRQATRQQAQLRESPAVYCAAILREAGIDPGDWYANFVSGVTFLGLEIADPIHADLATHLGTVETGFLQRFGGEARDSGEARNALGLHERIAGSRDFPTSAALSMHLFGLAIDVNYTANPFIGTSANSVFRRAGLLVVGTPTEYRNGMSYDELRHLDEVVTRYFSYLEDAENLASRLRDSSGLWQGLDIARARNQIQADFDELASRWERTRPGQR